MILTNELLNQYLDANRISIEDKQRKVILSLLGTEPDQEHCWTEQDIYEQLRKLLKK